MVHLAMVEFGVGKLDNADLDNGSSAVERSGIEEFTIGMHVLSRD